MGFDESSNARLVLELGFSSSTEVHMSSRKKLPATRNRDLDHFSNTVPSLTLSLSNETQNQIQAAKAEYFDNYKRVFKDRETDHRDLFRQDSTCASSLSNLSVKRERENGSSEDVEVERVFHGEDERKKLRLNKTQSALLEESFKRHSTLNPKQKQDLARELKLRPRQVEVWFQNRRARTKLKQTELDCEFLRKCCDALTEENRRLHKEFKELKALKLARPSYMQMPAATLTMCPSCERICGGAAENATKGPLTVPPKAAPV